MKVTADVEPAGWSGEATLPRFAPAVRALHWTVAVLVLTVAATGLVLYLGALGDLVGRRDLVRTVHVVTGLAMPVPLLVAYAGPWRTPVRRDVRRLSRWNRSDRRWLLSRGREATGDVGKFNAGQKLNAAFIAGMIPVMVGTGAIMRWHQPFPLPWRTGATFVHDWTAIATWVIVAGHILMALARPPALQSMLGGRMPHRWAEDHHPRWAADVAAEAPAEAPGA